MKTIITVLVVVALIAVGGVYYTNHVSAQSGPGFRTAQVKKGDLLPTIAATGTVQPEEVVDVGTQVQGEIKNFGIAPDDPGKKKPDDPNKKRLIDYGSTVHEGTILAYIDDRVYMAKVDQTQAALEHAKADLMQQQAKQEQAALELKRAESLIKLQDIPGSTRPIKGIADSDYETAVMNEKTGVANVELANASIKQAEADLKLAKTNLDYTVIKSPVEGVIIARRVNIGQTVVSSLNAPSLFLLAKDLSKMQVWASVNEADIGRIKADMPVRFTVDAFPNEIFRGNVVQVRDNANMTQNVVTFTVVVATDNSNKRLRPYLTANLQFEVDERHDVLTVTNAALRWKPKPAQIAPAYRDANQAEKDAAKHLPEQGAEAGGLKPVKPLVAKSDRGKLWVKEDEFVRPIEVNIGVSDGILTEVSGKEVKEGLEIVVGEARKDAAGDDTTNPFAPKMFGGKKKMYTRACPRLSNLNS